MNGLSIPQSGTAISQGQVRDALNPAQNAGANAPGGAEPKFKQVWDSIQSSMGAKPDKPREIKKTLDKDDFLRIMITQMKHQDPTKPFEADKMAAEMAQITSVEQLNNLNKVMTQMTQANRPLERLAMTNMIGKTVTIDKNRFNHLEGESETLTFALPEKAARAKVQLLSDSGEVVFEKQLTELDAGMNSVQWDGRKITNQAAKAGMYQIKVEAEAHTGKQLQIGTTFKGKIIGVSFQDKDPVFLVGDAQRHEKIGLNNIVQVDEVMGLPQMGMGQPMQAQATNPSSGLAPVMNSKSSSPAMISFEKGVGSKTMDDSAIPEELKGVVQAARDRLGAQMGARAYADSERAQAADSGKTAAVAHQAAQYMEKGFPNGLGDYKRAEQAPEQINPPTEKGGETNGNK
jgi:flagellar basal-body rod modification protein FlgD